MLFGKKGQGEALPAAPSGFSDPRSLLCARGCVCARPHSGGCSPGMPWEGGLPEGVWASSGSGIRRAWCRWLYPCPRTPGACGWAEQSPAGPWKLPAFHWPQERARGRLLGTLQRPFPGTGRRPCHHPAGFGRSPLPTSRFPDERPIPVLCPWLLLAVPRSLCPPGAAVGPGVGLSLFLFLFSLERKSSHLSHVPELPNLPSRVGMHK